MIRTQKQVTGAWGEQQALEFLQQNQYQIIEKNFRTRMGEIDIIAWHHKPHFGKTLVFVEVKTRTSGQGTAERAVGKSKMKNIFFAARAFCVQHHISLDTTPIQFEQVSVYGTPQHKESIQHYVIPVE